MSFILSKHKHLLVIRLSAMGDVAMTVPVIRAFVEQHPNITITVLSKPFLKPLTNQGRPSGRRVYKFPSQGPQ